MNAIGRNSLFCFLAISQFLTSGQGQAGHDAAPPPPAGLKTETCTGRPVPQLEDIAEKAGIHFRHVYSPDKKYIPESMSGGVVLIDYDRDGWPDIYFTNAPTIEMAMKHQTAKGALYHNNHDGTFTEVTDKAGIATPCFANGGAVGDYNNDGWPDLYITCLGENVLYRNNGDGTFTDVTEKAGVGDQRNSTGAAFGDYDNDGFVDLMVTNYVDFHFDNLPAFGKLPTCTFRGLDVQCGPRGLKGAGDTLYHNNGDGTFTDVSKSAGVDDPNGYFGLGVTWVDFNNTGRSDIFVANDATPNYLYKNEGNGKFTEIGLESGTSVSQDGAEQASMGVAIGDYLHEGRPSIYITNFENEYNTLYRNNGDWQFDDVSYKSGEGLPSMPYVKWGNAFFDVDNDGWLDLIFVSGHVYPQVATLPSGAGYQQPGMLQLNQQNGRFCNAGDQAGPALVQRQTARGLAIGDLFNDGQLDVVVENIDGAPMILRNHGVLGRHWVSLELAGTKSNRLAIGARIKLSAGGMTQTEQIRSGGSYLSQSDLRVHFGLGTATKIDSVEIRWPSASPSLNEGVFEGRTYKNAQIGLELTLAPALKFGSPELMESPARLDSVTAWDPHAREGIIFTANALSYYAVELRSTESRMQSLVHDLHQVGFEPTEGTTENKLGAVEFARRDFKKVEDTHPAMPAYETVFVRACAARELLFIFYGPDRESVKKLVTETELKFDLTISGCAGGLPKK